MPSPRLTFEQLRALVAVVDEGGYAKAADSLRKSQSSVTYAVQQLQAQLGIDVFRIVGRKAALTPTGQSVYRRARFLLDEATSLEESAKALSAGWEAEIRLAVEIIFPNWLLFAALDRFGKDSPNTRIEIIESVLGHRTDVLSGRRADLAIFGRAPPGFLGESLLRVRFVLAAHPDHPLHLSGRALRIRDLRPHRHLVVRESSAERTSATSLEATQRWTVGHLATSIEAARAGYGFAWLPEDRIRDELAAGMLKPLPLAEGGERFEELYLIFADREHAGPGVLRLADILREEVARAHPRQSSEKRSGSRKRAASPVAD
jgi:DNA-binding transcriptional LysR family regulator